MKDAAKKYKITILILAYIILISAIFYFAIFPLVKSIKSHADEVQKGIVDNEINSSKVNKISELEENYKNFSGKNISSAILAQDGEVEFIKSLETLADKTQNKISIKITEEDKNLPKSSPIKNDTSIISQLPSKDYILMEISLEGRYENLANFIHQLENSKEYINIISLDTQNFKNPEPVSSNIFYSSEKPAEIVPENNTLTSKIKIAVYINK